MVFALVRDCILFLYKLMFLFTYFLFYLKHTLRIFNPNDHIPSIIQKVNKLRATQNKKSRPPTPTVPPPPMSATEINNEETGDEIMKIPNAEHEENEEEEQEDASEDSSSAGTDILASESDSENENNDSNSESEGEEPIAKSTAVSKKAIRASKAKTIKGGNTKSRKAELSTLPKPSPSKRSNGDTTRKLPNAKKQKSGPAKPKNKKSAYECFKQNFATKFKENRVPSDEPEPETKKGKAQKNFADFQAAAALAWKNLPAAQKEPYQAQAAKDKIRYEKAMLEFSKLNPATTTTQSVIAPLPTGSSSQVSMDDVSQGVEHLRRDVARSVAAIDDVHMLRAVLTRGVYTSHDIDFLIHMKSALGGRG